MTVEERLFITMLPDTSGRISCCPGYDDVMPRYGGKKPTCALWSQLLRQVFGRIIAFLVFEWFNVGVARTTQLDVWKARDRVV